MLTATAAPSMAQSECSVTATFSGRWNRVELACDTTATQKPRAALVASAALRACPLLSGDRVAVMYENNDSARQPEVTHVQTRGGAGPSSGDWCNRGLAPGPYIGPCFIEEDPPVGERSDTVGTTAHRRSVSTWIRDTTDTRQTMSGRRCTPVELGPGVYRIYIEEIVWRATWKPGPTYFADRRTMEDASWETNRYEGGIYVDGSLPRTDTVTDLTSYVRGWNERVAATMAILRVTTETVVMTGLRFQTLRFTADTIVMTGVPK